MMELKYTACKLLHCSIIMSSIYPIVLGMVTLVRDAIFSIAEVCIAVTPSGMENEVPEYVGTSFINLLFTIRALPSSVAHGPLNVDRLVQPEKR